METTTNTIFKVLEHYFDIIEINEFKKLNNGLINQTYFVDLNQGEFILQKINQKVFKNIFAIIDNKITTTNFLSEKGFPVSKFIETKKGDFFVDNAEGIWQLSTNVKSQTFYKMDFESAAEVGRFLASFHKELVNLPSESIFVTIPDFHNTISRYGTLMSTLKHAPKEKLYKAQNEVNSLDHFYQMISFTAKAINNGDFPTRIVHNDTKISNFLFNEKKEVICLIDFDTIMPGCILADIGDAMRSGSNSAHEDEIDLEKVHFDVEIYEAFMKAYISNTQFFLTDLERDSLIMALPLILVEQACRFLTDFFDNDIYYPVLYADHNLNRAKTQIKLLTEVVEYIKVSNNIF